MIPGHPERELKRGAHSKNPLFFSKRYLFSCGFCVLLCLGLWLFGVLVFCFLFFSVRLASWLGGVLAFWLFGFLAFLCLWLLGLGAFWLFGFLAVLCLRGCV